MNSPSVGTQAIPEMNSVYFLPESPVLNVHQAIPEMTTKGRLPDGRCFSGRLPKSELKPIVEVADGQISCSDRGEGPTSGASHSVIAFAAVISSLRELHKKRVDFHRAEKALTLRCKSICLRLCGGILENAHALFDQVETGEGDSPHLTAASMYLAPLLQARDMMSRERKIPEKAMGKLAKTLPVWGWVDGIKGFGALGLAQIIGECGALNLYANPAKIWKRMGLAVFDGKAQHRTKDKEKAIVMGYSPARRCIMFCIGDSLIKKKNKYREIYLDRKVIEEQKAPLLTKMVWHRRAQRYMEKRLLRDLWRAWRDVSLPEAVS